MVKCFLWKPEDPSAISNTHTKGAALPPVTPGDGAGEMTQWSRVLAALPKALGSAPGIHIRRLIPVTQFQGIWPLWVPTHACCTLELSYTHK